MSFESRYVVRRLNWKSPVAGRYVRLPGWTEVAAFDAAETADADRRRREQEVRTIVNPFACAGSFSELSTLPGPILADWLMDGGLEPPATAPFAEWGTWWDAAAGTMTVAERAHAWAGFDKLRFYDAAQRPEAAIHVVLGIHWALDDERYAWVASFEGGYLVHAYRSVTAAQTRCRRTAEEVGAELRGDDDYYLLPRLLVGARAQTGYDPFFRPRATEKELSSTEAPYAETVVLPVADRSMAVKAAGRLFVVQRLSWSWHGAGDKVVWQPCLGDERVYGVPVMAFLSRKEAEAFAWELDFVTRLYLNPFRFGHPEDLSSVPELGFRSVLGDAGLDLPVDDWYMRPRWRVEPFPDEGVRGVPAAHPWEDWWAATADGMSAGQREAVWDLLDQLRFHQVCELELRD